MKKTLEIIQGILNKEILRFFIIFAPCLIYISFILHFMLVSAFSVSKLLLYRLIANTAGVMANHEALVVP